MVDCGSTVLLEMGQVEKGPTSPQATPAFVQTPDIFLLVRLIGLFLEDEPSSHLGGSTCCPCGPAQARPHVSNSRA